MPNRFVPALTCPALTCAAWLAGTAVLAQPEPSSPAKTPPAVAPVTVLGLAPPKTIRQQAHSFVQSYAAVSNPEIDQIGRWYEPVCVQVEGLARPEQAALVKARIEGVAQAVGLRPARAGCTANVEIVFTDWPQRMMDIVAKRHSYLLGYYHFRQRDRLKTVTRPIQSWYVTSTRSAFGDYGLLAFANASVHDGRSPDGSKIDHSGNANKPVATGGFLGAPAAGDSLDDAERGSPTGCGDAPRITGCYTSLFNNVFIVADSKALEGEDIGLVADYMVMLALSKPRSADGCHALPSVTDLLAKSSCPRRDAPDGLTPYDAAFLTALYKADLEPRKAFEQSDVARRMSDILIKASAGGR